jgi:hypothetical protein
MEKIKCYSLSGLSRVLGKSRTWLNDLRSGSIVYSSFGLTYSWSEYIERYGFYEIDFITSGKEVKYCYIQTEFLTHGY